MNAGTPVASQTSNSMSDRFPRKASSTNLPSSGTGFESARSPATRPRR